ncbi:MAG: DUF3320 domain-containing protein, partial [Maritimibacter sp.]|nr:DUF3320 domain-containing protein [Maritimibacter sp.]
PGQYLLAVECDGATYHSALWARERDRLRQDVLEGLGWTFHRIWSTDWFHRRSQEIARLRDALDQARVRATDGIAVHGANHERPMVAEEVDEAPEVFDVPDVLRLEVPAYVCADLRANTTVEPHAAPVSSLSKLAFKIVEIEGPIHTDEVARRIAAAFGKQRTGNRIQEAAQTALFYAMRTDRAPIRRDGDFWLTDIQATNVPVRSRSGVNGAPLKAAYLPPIEIRAAGELIRKESGEIELADLVKAVSQLFGFQRVGPELQDRISRVLSGG